MTTTIRDLREIKNLSQSKVAAACGLTYSRFVRVEEGSGKTSQEDVEAVLDVLLGMESGTRKMGGRPFNDPAKQAAVQAAREAGGSVAAALSSEAKPRRALRPNNDIALALAQKSPARVRRAKKVM